MIDKTMAFLLGELNAYLAARFPASANLAVLDDIVQETGTGGEDIENKLVVTLVNIEREPIAANTAKMYRQTGDVAKRIPQPLNLNLVFMIAANFPENYPDSLKVLSAAIAFFQSAPLFTPQANPQLPDALERLSVEWRELDLQASHNLWTVLGGRYRPSVVYKARMLIVDDAFIGADVPIITGADVEG